MARQMTAFRIDEHVLDELGRIATEANVSRSDLLRAAVDRLIENATDAIAALQNECCECHRVGAI